MDWIVNRNRAFCAARMRPIAVKISSFCRRQIVYPCANVICDCYCCCRCCCRVMRSLNFDHSQTKNCFFLFCFFVCSYFYQWVWRNSSWFVPVSNTNFVIEISSCSPCDFNYTLPSFTYRCKFIVANLRLSSRRFYLHSLCPLNRLRPIRIGEILHFSGENVWFAVELENWWHTGFSHAQQIRHWPIWLNENFKFRVFHSKFFERQNGPVRSGRSINSWWLIIHAMNFPNLWYPSEMHKVHLNTDYFVRVKMVTILCLSPSFALTYAFFFSINKSRKENLWNSDHFLCVVDYEKNRSRKLGGNRSINIKYTNKMNTTERARVWVPINNT